MDEQYRNLLIRWNYIFPLDRQWRKKYNVSLFSQTHLEANQLDIALEFFEEEVFQDLQDRAKTMLEKEEEYKQGILITTKTVSTSYEEELFSKLDITKFNE